MQMYGKFAGFPINSALFGLVSYNDPCFLDMLFFSHNDYTWLYETI